MTDYWPLRDLRISTPRLMLRVGTDDDLDQLAGLAAAGVHDPAVQPFGVPWTDQGPRGRGNAARAHHWSTRAAWIPQDWSCEFVVHLRNAGQVIGSQSLAARDFAVLREVRTGSWLGIDHHGHGYGTEMRAAVLHLAFAGLGAQCALSSCHYDNPASQRVSEKLGYEPDGVDRTVVRGRPMNVYRYALAASQWECPVEIRITGLYECREWFGG